jgi:competence protein ComEC
LLAAPAVVPATVLGVVCAAVATGSGLLAVPVAWLAAVPTAAIAIVARCLASLPGAGLAWPGGAATDVCAIALIIGGVTAGVLRPRRSARKRT